MSKRKTLIIIGVWMIVFLFIGFPSTWDKLFAIVTGIIVLSIGLKDKSCIKKMSNGSTTYVEYKNDAPSVSALEKKSTNDTTPVEASSIPITNNNYQSGS